MDDLNVTGRRRLVPRGDMPPRHAREFAEIVGSVEPEHLRACDAAMVEHLAVARVLGRDLAERVEAEGAVLPDGSINPALRALRYQQGVISTLSSRLRLTPSSRADRKVAGVTTRSATAGVDAAFEFIQERKHA